jgi:hypothetical protein
MLSFYIISSYNLYSSPNIIRAKKSVRMRRAGYVALTERTRNIYKFLLENLKVRDHLGDLGVDGMI